MKIIPSKLIAGSGFYAFAEIDKKVKEMEEKGVKVITFGVGDPKEPTPDFIIDSLSEAAKDRAAYGYPSYIGDASFRQASADYIKREFGVDLNIETEITASIGSKESVFHFPRAFVDEGDIVICPTPGYPPYKKGTEFAGGTPYFVSLTSENNFLIDYESIPEDVCQKAKIIWTCYPNSPTGKFASREYLEGLVAWAQKHEIIIAADEGCYHEIYFDQKPVSILEIARDGIVVFYSLSKTFNMTGYRAGFVAGDERIIANFRKIKTQIDSGCPTFVQDAASTALRDTEFPKKMRAQYEEKRNIMLDVFREIGLPECESEGTFYLWQKAPEGMTGEDLAMKLIEKGIVVTPGAWISDEDENGLNPGLNYVRFALVATLEECKDAAERIRGITL
ncbi:MAG: aminotransferase class I/II-fold pyridoxal phosphate-dependent enzyme [Candidatus Peregrinibacteria bacterium]|nr:aminotransferase class I/II-fold pyridoxal phosphate-dependent enzyme [Candidatus Peregrinibacteria bacterium]